MSEPTDDLRKRGADIEIYETTKEPSAITTPRGIRINGTEVGRVAGYPEINLASGIPSVTITFYARTLTIKQELAE